jgi:phage terminase large subunit-like protein
MQKSILDLKLEKLELLKLKAELLKNNKLNTYYPDHGPVRRELYVKHNQFFEAGIKYRERLMLAANRIGKTEGVGGYEATLHLTGLYPAWWKGRRYSKPVSAWAAGDTGKTVREIIQFKLLGPFNDFGTGLIPKDLIVKTTTKIGVAEAVDTIYVKHVSGGVSEISLKSYDQKRISFQGTEKDFIWLDEEPPIEIYVECLLRTMTNNGMLMLTFTPLMGMSETVMAFLPGGDLQQKIDGSKFVVMATWDDAPHLSEEVKKELWNSIPPFQRDARSKGVPQLGSGAIYPVPESEIVVDDFEIPIHWPRGYGMDVGWNRTSAGFWTKNPETKVIYRYSDHYRGQAEPAIHAQAIKARGTWLEGVIDPASRGRSQVDGQQLLKIYKELGLHLSLANNSVEAGIYKCWEMMSSGQLKIFKSCQNWLYEYRLYRRDEKGHIVKTNDHAMDEMRYFIMSGIDKMKLKPVEKKFEDTYTPGSSGNWMG